MDGHDGTGTGDRTSRRTLLTATGAVATAAIAGCLGNGDESGNGDGGSDDGANEAGGNGGGSDGGEAAWRTAELTTVRGEETFSIDGLEPPVVVQSFAVWCPKCRRQSEELAGLAESTTVVGLNTDPNEDAAKVRQHADGAGFEWRFAVAPSSMTDSLVDEFGPTVTNAPSTPLVVACGDSATFDAGGVRSTDDVRSIVDGC